MTERVSAMLLTLNVVVVVVCKYVQDAMFYDYKIENVVMVTP